MLGMEILSETNFAYGLKRYEIPHITVSADTITKEKKQLFLIDGKQFKVESFASQFFRNNGFTVFNGDSIHLYFSFLSYNFKDSFFYEVCNNYIGANCVQYLENLQALVLDCITKHQVTDALIDYTQFMLEQYYQSGSKTSMYRKFTEQLKRFDRSLLLRLLLFYRSVGYTTKGAPDIVITKNSEFAFIEVKSVADSLSSDQYTFFEEYLNTVGRNIYVFRVLPSFGTTTGSGNAVKRSGRTAANTGLPAS